MGTRTKFISIIAVLVAIVNIGIAFAILNQPRPVVAAISGYKLTPILMIPADKVAKPEYQNSINQAMGDVRDWYAKQIGSTFKYDPVVTVTSSHPDSYFRCSTGSCAIAGGVGTDYNLVNNDLDILIGPRNAQVDRVIFLVGAGPLAIGGGSLDSSRFAILGDTNLDGISGLLLPATINQQKGALAHEIGHTFDLPHPESDLMEYKNLMGIGWIDYPNVLVNDTNAVPESKYLKKSPFLLKQAVVGCTQFTGSHLSITQNTVLCPGVFRINGSTTGVISIDADNVTFDGSNASFIGNDTTSGKYGLIMTGRANVTVKNIRLSGYFYGFKVETSSNIVIQDSVANYNRRTDGNFLYINIAFPGEGGGIVFNNVANSTVKNNVLNNQNTGIHLFNSSNNTIENNHAGFNKTWGVALFGSVNNSVIQNDTQHVNRCIDGGCDSAGILLVQGSDNNLIEGNNMNYSGDGFFLGNGTAPVTTNNNNLVRNNVANFSPNNGYEATFSTGNLFLSNEAVDNNYGFWLGYSHDGQLVDNFIKDNRTNGVDIDRGRGWVISGNTFRNNVSGLNLHNNGVYDPNWVGTEVSNNYSITNNSFVANSFGLNIQNTQSSTVQNNTFTANDRNVSYGDTSLATSGITTNNNNFICLSSGAGPSNLILNKPVTTNIAAPNPEKANDGDTTDPNKSFYIGTTAPGQWWKADMGSVKALSSLVIYSWAGNPADVPTQFHIEVSTSGNFSGEQITVATETDFLLNGSRPRYRIYTFDPINTQYIRVVIDNSENWKHWQEIEAYNDPNITSTYSPNSVCSYNFYNNLPSNSTTNLQSNYWEYAPLTDLATSVYDKVDNASLGTADYSNQLGAKATTSISTAVDTLSFTSPVNGAALNGTINITLNPTLTNRTSRVNFYLNDIYFGQNFSFPFDTSFDTRRLANGSYSLKAIVLDNSGNSTTTIIPVTINNTFISDVTAPSVPSGLATTNVTSSQVGLTWTASIDNVGVSVYYVKRNGVVVAEVGSNSYIDTTVSAGATYSYTVSAVDPDDNVSADSSSLLVTASNPTDTQPPTVPTNLVATVVSTTEIDLSWTQSTDNVSVTGYEVFRDGNLLTTTATNSFNNTGLSASTGYSYYVKAVDAVGNISQSSNNVSVTTDATPPDTQLPTVPTNLVTTVVSTSEIDLSWDASYDNTAVASYQVFRNGIGIGVTNTMSYQDTGLSPGTTYRYTVTATDDAGNTSAQSIEVSATTNSTGNTTPTTPSNPGKIGDLNNDNVIDIYDLSILLSQWRKTGVGDINKDGAIDIYDLSILLSKWRT